MTTGWGDPERRGQETRILVLGTGNRAQRISAQLESWQRRTLRVIGFLDDDPSEEDRRGLGRRYLGRLDHLGEVVARECVDRVIFGLPRSYLAHDVIANAIGICEALGVDFSIPVDLFDTRVARIAQDELAGLRTISFSVQGGRPVWQFALKRAIDVVGALAVLLVTLPVWLFVALAIKLDSPGPIFFVQRRCGQYGKVFPFYKFRTMRTDAEARKAELRALNEKSGPVFKIERDPRVTRVGRLLRKYSIDELPQVLNVLMGHMSLVGPRPPVPAEVEKYELDHRGRLSMRPGITCLWQVSGRNEIEFEDWVKLDIEYVERWSLLLDLQILLATFPAVISGRGAS
jgi:exopolysaccharide biosynthesis polyprenyl glycosylphosphotransferase